MLTRAKKLWITWLDNFLDFVRVFVGGVQNSVPDHSERRNGQKRRRKCFLDIVFIAFIIGKGFKKELLGLGGAKKFSPHPPPFPYIMAVILSRF